MQIESESLIEALRGSGLFTPQEFVPIEAELRALGTELQVLLRHLVERQRLTTYQLRKVVNGRASELFVGPYVLTDKLGEGGMGKVFRARHARNNREVALKVVREHLLAKPTARGRYEREVQAALALSHPNIVAVASAGSTDGRYFLEMEFVDGLDLARLVQKYGVLSVSEACEYARQAALGLHHAHELGFVHRDIKPSNIMVSGSRHIPEATEPAFVKILDMGLVRMIGDDDAERGLTRDGTVVGTPDYMAPEQAKNSRIVDRRADLYSLGAAFHFMLTGKPPFPDGTALDKIICHVDHAPPLLSASRDDVPEELVRVVDRLMAKKPDQRFATALELAEQLLPLTSFAKHPVEPPRLEAKPTGSDTPQRADSTPVHVTEDDSDHGDSDVDAGADERIGTRQRDRFWLILGIAVVVAISAGVLTLVARVALARLGASAG